MLGFIGVGQSYVGDIGVGVFRKIMALLVDHAVYGSEIWRGNWDLEKIECMFILFIFVLL